MRFFSYSPIKGAVCKKGLVLSLIPNSSNNDTRGFYNRRNLTFWDEGKKSVSFLTTWG